jgi:CrcB protein
LIGFLATAADEHRLLSPTLRLFLIAGVLGGFTTFSTFGLETWRLVEDGALHLAIGNAAASMVATLVAVVLGVLLARAIS